MPAPTIRSAPGGGGFLIDSTSVIRNTAAHAATSSEHRTRDDDAAKAPRRLTPVQITRLRSHLDSLLLSIQRRFAKRFEPEFETADPLDSLPKYLAQWDAQVLPLVAQIDPVGAQQTTTAVAYAMSITDAICQGIMGYPLVSSSTTSSASSSSTSRTAVESGPLTLYAVLALLHLLDALWSALLVGRRLEIATANRRAKARLSQQVGLTPKSSDASLRDSTPLQGSMGTRTASVTDRVRLRNLLSTRKDDLQSWLAHQAGISMPLIKDNDDDNQLRMARDPRSEGRKRGRVEESAGGDANGRQANAKRRRQREQDNERRSLFEEQGDIDANLPKDGIDDRDDSEGAEEVVATDGATNQTSSEEDSDLEEVDISVPAQPADGTASADDVLEAGADAEEDTEERKHFRQLFDRKIDPDADDDSDEGDSGPDDAPQDDVEDNHHVGSSTLASATETRGLESKDVRMVTVPRPEASQQDVSTHHSADQDGDSAAIALPQDPLQVQALGSRLFSRTLALLERLESLL